MLHMRKGHLLVLLGCRVREKREMVWVWMLWYLETLERWMLLWFRHVIRSIQKWMLLLDVPVVDALAVGNECCYGCSMDALVIRKNSNMDVLTWMLGNPKHSNMDVMMVSAWMPRNTSFKNELLWLCRHCVGDCGGERSAAEQLEEPAPQTVAPRGIRALLSGEGLPRKKKTLGYGQDAGSVQKLKICSTCSSHTMRPHPTLHPKQ